MNRIASLSASTFSSIQTSPWQSTAPSSRVAKLGGAITMVGTTFTFAPNEDVGTGYYVLVVTNAD